MITLKPKAKQDRYSDYTRMRRPVWTGNPTAEPRLTDARAPMWESPSDVEVTDWPLG